MADDPDRDLLGRMLATLHTEFGSADLMVKDIVDRADDIGNANHPELRDLIIEATNHNYLVPKRFGHWLKRHVGQVVGGLKLMKADVTRNAQAWKIQAA